MQNLKAVNNHKDNLEVAEAVSSLKLKYLSRQYNL